MYTVKNVFDSAVRPFSGVSARSFTDINGIVADAVRSVSNNVTLVESKRTKPLLPALYLGDNYYFCPEDADTIIDIYPTAGRDGTTDFNQASPFSINRDRYNLRTEFTIEYRNGVKVLRAQPGFINDTPIILHDGNSLTDDGTVVASNGATNLALNEVFALTGSASLDFNITGGSGVATITITNMEAKDISTITRDGAFTVGVYVPQPFVGKITSLQLQVGSDSSNYISMLSNTTAYGGALIEGFNIVRFERRNATSVGTIDTDDIDYLQFEINHTASTDVIGVKLDAFVAHKGIGYEVAYYSNYYFIEAQTGALIEKPTSINFDDKIILSKESFELVVLEARKIMDMELRGEAGGSVYKQAERELMGIWGDFSNPGLYETYRQRYPSERRSTITQYTDYHYE